MVNAVDFMFEKGVCMSRLKAQSHAEEPTRYGTGSKLVTRPDPEVFDVVTRPGRFDRSSVSLPRVPNYVYQIYR